MSVDKPTTILTFGVFDHLHPGHQFLLKHLESHADTVVVVVTPDELVEQTKGAAPFYNLEQRIEMINTFNNNYIVQVGDTIRGEWTAIKQHTPDVIAVGYDQDSLHNALQAIKNEYNFNIVLVDAFHPEKYKSSLLGDR